MKKIMILLGICLLYGCATQPKTNLADFRETVDKSLKSYGQALVNKDTEAWLALHDENVIKMPQDSMPVVGMDALRADINMGMEMVDILEFKTESKEYELFGDLGYARGFYSVERRLRKTGQKLPRFEGKYFTVYRRQPDGSWKIYRDIYSSNLPPAQ